MEEAYDVNLTEFDAASEGYTPASEEFSDSSDLLREYNDYTNPQAGELKRAKRIEKLEQWEEAAGYLGITATLFLI